MELNDPTTRITAQLRMKLNAVPFLPFAIVMSNQQRFEVPTADHLMITRIGRRIEWEFESKEGLQVAEINPLHIASIQRLKPAA